MPSNTDWGKHADSPNVGGIVVDINCLFFDFRHVELFRKYLRSKSKVVRNRTGFWTFFFAFPNFRRQAFQKLYPRYHPCLAIRRVEKFRQDIPTSSKVIGAHTLNFRPNFKFSRLTLWGGGIPSPLGCALASLALVHAKL